MSTADPLLRGRFAGGVHPALHAANRSFDVDKRMWREDLDGSVAHARMLGATGILGAASVERILAGLEAIRAEFAAGSFPEHPDDEDIHMAVERRLTELVGEDGKRLHTGRSRNDQVATDLRLWLRRAGAELAARVRAVQALLVELAAREGEAVLPYYTHLQRAQPVLLGHHLLAYVEMLEPDRVALETGPRECPLGAGAGTGSSFPLDREATARELGFERPSPNSMEAVSSRRDAAVFAHQLACVAVTLSRFGADLVLWCSREFGFLRLGDAVSTGSSIMPQKRNPDGAELLRGLAVRVAHASSRLLELQRGLPLGYSKDLQEDKSAVFDAHDTLAHMLAMAEAMLGDAHVRPERMRAAVEDPAGFLLATEAADWLVRQGVSFREAHEAVGALVRAAEECGVGLEQLDADTRRACHPEFDERLDAVLSVEAALAARGSTGGTAPERVAAEIEGWRARLSG